MFNNVRWNSCAGTSIYSTVRSDTDRSQSCFSDPPTSTFFEEAWTSNTLSHTRGLIDAHDSSTRTTDQHRCFRNARSQALDHSNLPYASHVSGFAPFSARIVHRMILHHFVCDPLIFFPLPCQVPATPPGAFNFDIMFNARVLYTNLYSKANLNVKHRIFMKCEVRATIYIHINHVWQGMHVLFFPISLCKANTLYFPCSLLWC